MRIHYERDGGGYQIGIHYPTANYPMFQVTCNDEDNFFGTKVFLTMEEVSEAVNRILSRADACVVMT